LHGAVFRVNVAVCFFVVASGFVTHWAYGSLCLSGVGALVDFYLRRFGRVFVTFWVALALAVAALAALGEDWGDAWYVTRCALFIEQWVRWCPNGPSWFVFAMLPSWLLYPLTRRVVASVEDRGGAQGLLWFMGALYTVSFGPAVALFLIQRGNITMQQHADMSFWPPAQLADFAMGVATAALVRRRDRRDVDGLDVLVAAGSSGEDSCGSDGSGASPARRASGLVSTRLQRRLADACAAVVVMLVLLLPRPEETVALNLNGWEPMLDHGLAPALSGFLYFAAVCGDGEESVAARALGHEALVSLGADSFEVYIFQRPVHDIFRLLLDMSATQAFVAYVVALWSFAAAYRRVVQAPVDGFFRRRTAA